MVIPRRRDKVRARKRLATATLLVVCILAGQRPVGAYSVLAHQGTVDAMWDQEIVPLLRDRFGELTPAQIVEARAYAYGGSLIQDLGYYPFGSHLFTNLTHYVRTGDFVAAMIRGAADANAYAFALGALAHYASDTSGHPLAVNRVVPMVYPKIRQKVGPEALYVDSPARHVMVEFAFDVSQVARGGYAAQNYHEWVGFKVAKDLLKRAVQDTYSLELDDMLLNLDLAIGTYRRAVSSTIPELTRLAWRDKREEIERANPGITEATFVYALSRQDFEREFGTEYRKPGILARVLAFCAKILPKVGPFRPLAFEPLTESTERLFVDSLNASRARYASALRSLRAGRLDLVNTDFDTGQPAVMGVNRLADRTHLDLLHKLATSSNPSPSTPLRQQLTEFFANPRKPAHFTAADIARLRGDLAQLNGW